MQPVLTALTLSVLAALAAPTRAAETSNPAAAFCVEQGGSYRIVDSVDGQRGLCMLADGRELDAWDFFRAQHDAAPSPETGAAPADRIWTGGPILTMDDAAMQAEALAERDGLILAVGAADAVMALRGPDTDIIDLAGRTMIPGFVDAHGHVFMIGLQALAANTLPAPDGPVNDIPALQQVLRDFAEAQPERVGAAGLILGFGYDDAQLAELRHPTRDELDAVSTDIPVYVIHQSGHLGVANSKALELAGITADTPDPAGGVIRRRESGSEPDGVLEENAANMVIGKLLGGLDEAANRAIFRAGVELIASYGYTTAQEGRSIPPVAELMRAVATEEGLDIDVVTYADVLVDRDYILENQSRDYTDRFRVGGAKLTIDGSPQGFTALRDRPYYNPPEGFRADYAGYANATGDQVFDAIDWAFANDVQILTHANGEGASDMLIGAIDTATRAHGPADRRPVLIHGQFLREDQIDAYNRLDVFPVALSDAHLLLGRLAPRTHGRPGGRRRHLAHRLGPRTRHDVLQPPRRAGGLPRFHADPRRHRHPPLAVRRHHRPGAARRRAHRAQGHDDLARLPAFRGGPQGLARAGQAGRSGDPLGRPDRNRPRDPRHDLGARDHQGRRDDLPGGAARGQPALPPARGWHRPLRGLPAHLRHRPGDAGRLRPDQPHPALDHGPRPAFERLRRPHPGRPPRRIAHPPAGRLERWAPTGRARAALTASGRHGLPGARRTVPNRVKIFVLNYQNFVAGPS